jgi:transcriptional regulator GlxA family with amidase domain
MLHIVARVLGEEIDRARKKPKSRPTARERFVRLVNEMPAAELINRPNEDWARLCRCSVRHFNRLFRDFFGISLNEKQAELRLAKASQTLHQLGAGVLGATLESCDSNRNWADQAQRTPLRTKTDQPV